MSKNKILGLKDFYRTHLIERFNIIHTHRRQTIAEHHAMVALIADKFARSLGISSTKVLYLIQIYATNHDLPEVVTGDLPTPLKSIVDRKKLDDVERACGGHYLSNIERVERSPPEKLIKSIVKIADMFDAMFFLDEFGYGDHASAVSAKIKDRSWSHILDCQLNFPDYQWEYTALEIMREFNKDATYIEDIIQY